jgi:hypothetical protein
MMLALAFAEMSARPWRPGFGDNTIIGWTITASYFVATAFCFAAWRREVALEASVPAGRQPNFLLGLTLAMLFLGLNKQLDMQILVGQIGREALQSLGLYGGRRRIQLAFIAVVAIVACFAVWRAFAYTRRVGARYRFALVGIIYLAAFVIIRTASFHHIDILLGTRIEDVKINTFFELGGTLSVAFGAFLILWRERGTNV